MDPASAFAVALLVSVHLGAGSLSFLSGTPRSRWLSFAGGLSVAYVFIHLFPELQVAQASLDDHLGPAWLDHHAWLIALVGLIAFYGLENRVARGRAPASEPSDVRHDRRAANLSGDNAKEGAPIHATEGASDGVFALHMASFAAYNALIGYLLVHRIDDDITSLVAYTIAMALHFTVNDHALLQDHRRAYRRIGRWVLSAAILAGYALGLFVQLSEATVHVLFALLAGGIVLNVLKEELPAERESRFLPFVGGAAVYAGLSLAA